MTLETKTLLEKYNPGIDFGNNIRNITFLGVSNLKLDLLKQKTPAELFKKYFGNIDNIKDRSSINNLNFIKHIYWAIDKKEITTEEYKKILEYGFYLAFKKEIKSTNGKIGIKNIINFEEKWKKIFEKNLSGTISKEKAQDLFLLSWIESNGIIKKENGSGAIGPFQILLSTAKKYNNKITKKQLENNFILSAEIASRYLNDIISKEVNKDKNDEEKIATALNIYNGNFIKRFKDKYRGDFQKTLYELYKDLSFVYTSIANNEKIEKLKEIHNKYFNTSGDGNGVFPGTSHFEILEKSPEKQTIDKIKAWIEKYLKTILKQQSMYPIQFNAIERVYSEYKNKLNKK